ncbi:MAG TPA: 1,4-alpha-glucan branching protein domain-containing protein, partial [Actinomycetales bacterium]
WRHGGAPVLRDLADHGAVELLGGPATHPFLPLLEPAVADLALRTGLDDARVRLGRPPGGIWAPECGHAPGLERLYAEAGVTHLVVDEATLAPTGRPTSAAWTVGGTDVVAFARDLSVTDLVWSSRTGYPAHPAYRDFHRRDARSGLQLWAVGDGHGGQGDRPAYDPGAAERQVRCDAASFVDAVRIRLLSVAERDGGPGLVVAAYDTELFGHWWHEGPQFVDAVLRLLPEAGVRVTTLARAAQDGAVRGAVDLPAGSWGAGKDFRVWAGEPVRPLVDDAYWVQRRLLDVMGEERRAGRLGARRADLDQLARQALLALSSDWAFMITRDQAADYALRRAAGHTAAFHALAEQVQHRSPGALATAARQRRLDGPFPALDARLLATG